MYRGQVAPEGNKDRLQGPHEWSLSQLNGVSLVADIIPEISRGSRGQFASCYIYPKGKCCFMKKPRRDFWGNRRSAMERILRIRNPSFLAQRPLLQRNLITKALPQVCQYFISDRYSQSMEAQKPIETIAIAQMEKRSCAGRAVRARS